MAMNISIHAVRGNIGSLSKSSSEVSHASNDIDRVRGQISWNIRARNGINDHLQRVSTDLNRVEAKLKRIETFVHDAMNRYSYAEDEVVKLAEKTRFNHYKSQHVCEIVPRAVEEEDNRFKNLLHDTSDVVGAAWSSSTDFVSNSWTDATNVLNNSWDSTKDYSGGVWHDTSNFMENAWGKSTDFVQEGWDRASDLAGGAWTSTTKLVDDTWHNTQNIMGAAWNSTTTIADESWEKASGVAESAWTKSSRFVKTAYEDTKDVLNTTWDVSRAFVKDAYHQTADVMETAWDATVHHFKSVEWKEVGSAVITITDGAFELAFGTEIIAASITAAVSSAGAATPLAIAGGVGGGYLALDGANKIASGFTKMVDDLFVNPGKDDWVDIPNIIEEGHKDIWGDDKGSKIYTAEQIGIGFVSAGSLAKKAPELIDDGVKGISSLLFQKGFDSYQFGDNVYSLAQPNKDESEEKQ
ncbi:MULTISPECIES: hypothetical protein [Pontibacillus]|uniref:WXG100 family type VII secretion target n=1 Tax=Pontibacillus chungwhensis TaxID=265426 RepID=A0ABY8UWS5_9BACI|nr:MULTISPECIES: hypothetical protein [Pontibacillus]MCD5324194.1 hypothetical protein [Pontibacillus sp. HN14]WIF97748.1 hypothetical protein QNI29_18795 [Pontibacillus chungwhensis]